MNKEAQRIAIARACGLEVALDPKYQNLICAVKKPGKDPYDDFPHWGNAPNYLNDLNACHEMEKVLNEEQISDYIIELGGLCQEPDTNDWKMVCCATAAQRCEAFLRTLNLWQEDERTVKDCLTVESSEDSPLKSAACATLKGAGKAGEV